MRTLRAAGAVALVLGLAAGAVGCGGDEKVTVKDADGNKVEIDTDGDGVSVTGEDGETLGSVSSGELPADFPEDDVPIVDGKIAYAVSSGEGEDGWSLQITVNKSLDDCYADGADKLTDEGYEAEGEGSFGETKTGSFTSEDFRVALAATATGGACTLIYGVQPVAP